MAAVDFTIILTTIGGGAMGGDGVGVIMAGAGIIAITPTGKAQRICQRTAGNFLPDPEMGAVNKSGGSCHLVGWGMETIAEFSVPQPDPANPIYTM